MTFTPNEWTATGVTIEANHFYDFWAEGVSAFIMDSDDLLTIPISAASVSGGTISANYSLSRQIAEDGVTMEPGVQFYMGRTAANELLIGFSADQTYRWNIDQVDIIHSGVPVGGTLGQFLRKKSAANYDDEWADVNVPEPRSAAPLANQFGVSGAAGSSTQYARGDHRHGTPGVPSGGGLNQAAVDARVAAGTADWAQHGNTDNIPRSKLVNAPTYTLPAKLRDFGADLLNDGYTTVPNSIDTAYLGDKPTLSIAEDAVRNYGNSNDLGPRYQNQYPIIQLTAGKSLANVEAIVGRTDYSEIFARYPASAWERLGTSGGFDRYTLLIADKPADDSILVRELDPWALTPTKLRLICAAVK